MQTCRQCGAALGADDGACPSCGKPCDVAQGAPKVPKVPGADAAASNGAGANAGANVRGRVGVAAADGAGARTDSGGDLGNGAPAGSGARASGGGAEGPHARATATAANGAGTEPVDPALEHESLSYEEPPPVPAGTWASDEPEASAAAVPETGTARLRRPAADVRSFDMPSAADAKQAGVRASHGATVRATPRERGDRTERRPRVRPDAVGRSGARALAIAPEPTDELDSVESAPRGGRVVAFRGAPGASRRGSTAPFAPAEAREGGAALAASAAKPELEANAALAPAPARPQWLASELLRERPPAEPYAWTSRGIAVGSGIAGTASAIVFGEGGIDLAMVALFALIATFAMLPIQFLLRAGGLGVFGFGGLVYSTWLRIQGGEDDAIGFATLGAALLAAAQLLRAVRRTSRFARAAMVVGIAVAAGWLALGGGLRAMIVTDATLEGWIGPAVRAALLVVLALSLLGFLDDSGPSGCEVWPWLVLAWLCLEAAGAAVLGRGPLVAVLATPLFAAVAAAGWMQVWAVTPGLGARARV
jgi:hypothetical protein